MCGLAGAIINCSIPFNKYENSKKSSGFLEFFCPIDSLSRELPDETSILCYELVRLVTT